MIITKAIQDCLIERLAALDKRFTTDIWGNQVLVLSATGGTFSGVTNRAIEQPSGWICQYKFSSVRYIFALKSQENQDDTTPDALVCSLIRDGLKFELPQKGLKHGIFGASGIITLLNYPTQKPVDSNFTGLIINISATGSVFRYQQS